MIGKLIGSLIRHALTAAAGFLASIGLLDASQNLEGISGSLEEILLAVLLYFIGQGWSLKKLL